jgi:r1t holin
MFSDPAFWKAAGERALKTFAQSLIAYIGVGAVGVLHLNWTVALEVSATATLLSLLTSIVSANLGTNDGPSLTSERLRKTAA